MGSLLEKGHRKMDEKKVREAIKAMENQIAIIQKIPEYLELKEKTDEQIKERQTIIEALEKQLPKEIKAIDPERSEEFGDVEFCCPNCNSHYLCDIADVPNYCPECGIRFDT